MIKASLRLDWCSHEAAKYACINWHYSKCLPVGKLVKVGVWEEGKFIGVIIYGRGANHNMLKPFDLKQEEGCELVRIALTSHANQVSRIMAIASRFLKKSNLGLRLIVSYSDLDQGHHGGIYQANGWIYTGKSAKATKVWYKGKWSHKKTVDDRGLDQSRMKKKVVQGKHRYLMPLDNETRARLQSLSKQYPKRAKKANSENHSESGGAVPTSTLQNSASPNSKGEAK